MKKLYSILITILVLIFTGCYDDFRLDYDYSSVAFSTADGGSNIPGVLHRTVVKDEGLKLDVGIFLAGVLDNQEDRWADFQIDPSLLDAPDVKGKYELMPSSYYTLSNASRFIIEKGNFLGKVTITLDSVKFLADPKTASHVYAIPIRLTTTSEDSILSTQSTKLVVVKYINHYEGFYDQTGSFTYTDLAGVQGNSTTLKNVRSYTTLLHDTVYSDGMLNLTGVNYMMKLHVNSDNSVFIKEHFNPAVSVLSILEGVYSESFTWKKFDEAGKQVSTKTESVVNRTFLTVDENTMNVANKVRSMTKVNNYSFDVKVNTDNSLTYSNFKADSTGTTVVSEGVNTYNPVTKTYTLQYKVSFPSGAYELVTASYVWNKKNRDRQFVTLTGENKYDPATSTLTLNYKMQSLYGDFYVVSSKMVWRNRIRDGVNEWRR